MAGGLIASAPTAGAGCLYGGNSFITKCDGPIADDGTWQRCVTDKPTGGAIGTYTGEPDTHCHDMGPYLPPPLGAAADPPTHIGD